jgi:hypothetical protein
MKVTQKAIKRLIETGAAVDVSKWENYRRDPMSTVLYYSVGESGINAAALVLWDGTIHAVVGRVNNLFIMIR